MLPLKVLKISQWEFFYLFYLTSFIKLITPINFYCLYYYYSVFKKRWLKRKKLVNMRWKFRYHKDLKLPTKRVTRKGGFLKVFGKKFLKKRFKLLKRWVAARRFWYYSKRHKKYKLFVQRFKKKFLFSKNKNVKKKKTIKRKRHVNVLKYFSLKQIVHTFPKMVFSRWQRLFLTQKRINRFCMKFLYYSVFKSPVATDRDRIIPKLKRKKNVIYVNLHRSPIWKMRMARYAHWQLRTKGKLNEWRYHKLLNWELRRLVKVITLQLLQYILLNSYSVVLSWKQIFLLLKFNIVVLNSNWCNKYSLIKEGDIIELPFKLLRKSNKKTTRRFIRLINRVKWLNYKRFLSKTKKTVRRYQFVPKLFKRLPMGIKKFGVVVSYDPSLQIFGVIYKLPIFQHNMREELSHSSVLTLQNWRYRFD